MNKGDVRVWRFAVLGFAYAGFRVLSPYYKTRRGAEQWLEKRASILGVYLIQSVNVPICMAEAK